MAIIIATLLLFLAGPFVLWPLLRTPPDFPSPLAGEGGPAAQRPGRMGGT